MSAPEYITRITRLTVLPKGEPIYGECATHIEIINNGAGESLKITQAGGHIDLGKSLAFEPAEWPEIKTAVDQMLGYIELNEREEPTQ